MQYTHSYGHSLKYKIFAQTQTLELDSLGRSDINLAYEQKHGNKLAHNVLNILTLHCCTSSYWTCITEEGPPLEPNRSNPLIASMAA